MALEITGLRKSFDGHEVLSGASFACEPGAITALMGANGAGKSTLLRIVAGLTAADSGRVQLDGSELVPARRGHLGYMAEDAEPSPHVSVREFVGLVAALKSAPPPAPELIDRVGVTPSLTQSYGALSLGQRRRACLLAALVGDPEWLVLDEPTVGLDPGGVQMLAALLRERAAAGKGILLASHDLDFLAAVEARRLRLSDGRVLA